MTTQECEAWDRRPDEDSWDFARFCIYRDMGPSRSVAEAVRLWLSARPTTRQQRRFRTVKDPDEYAHRAGWPWEKLSASKGWVARSKAFDEAVEREARGRAVLDHVEEEAEQRRLRIVAARTLRSSGLAVWERFSKLVDEGKLEEMLLEKMQQTLTGTVEGGHHSRVVKEIPSIASLLALGKDAIAEGLKIERLELGEVTDRTALEGFGDLSGVPMERLRRVRERLRELIGDDDEPEAR